MAGLLHGFYATDLDAVAAALAADNESSGEVTSSDLPLLAQDGHWIFPRKTLWNQAIFGPVKDLECACGKVKGSEHAGETCDRCGTLCGSSALRGERFGHVQTAPHIHPAAYPALAEALGVSLEALVELAHGASKLLEDAPVGPRAIVERLGEGHPLMPFCRVERVPVPPANERPFVAAGTFGPEQVHPWIGPLNELWRAFVVKASRERRLIELEAPDIILTSEAIGAQALLARIWSATRAPPALPSARPPPALANDGRLVPPLSRPPELEDERDELEMQGIAFAGPDRLVLQDANAVTLLDLSGKLLRELPPAGCRLVGALSEGTAVFFEYFSATHPYLREQTGFGDDHVRRDDESVIWLSPVCGELSALDAVSEKYLERAPEGLPPLWPANDQPEDLMLGDLAGDDATPLAIGGDRPGLLAMSPGLGFAWAGEGSESQIFDLRTGVPLATPCSPENVSEVLELESGALRAPDEEEQDTGYYEDYGAPALAFDGERWRLLWENAVLSDHAGARPVLLRPAPAAAAFDASGKRLAVRFGERVALIDVETLAVTRLR